MPRRLRLVALSTELLLLLLLLPAVIVSASSSNSNKHNQYEPRQCTKALVEADANDDAILDKSEFVTFCNKEAHRTPLQLFVSEQDVVGLFRNKADLPPQLEQVFDMLVLKQQQLHPARDATSSSYSGIDISGATDVSLASAQQKAVLEILCGRVRSEIAFLLEQEAVVAKGGTTSRQGGNGAGGNGGGGNGPAGGPMGPNGPVGPEGPDAEQTQQGGGNGGGGNGGGQRPMDAQNATGAEEEADTEEGGTTVAQPPDQQIRGKPNIIVMQPDDLQFFDDWGAPPNNPSSPDRTVRFPSAGLPNIEQLRTGGLQMMQAYTASPMCGTSRYSTMTGKYPSRAASSRKRSTNKEEDVQTVDIPTTKLEDVGDEKDCTEENLAVAFQTAGYRTGMIGKWHLSKIDDDTYTYEGAVETVQMCGFDTADGLYIENLAASKESFNNYSDGTFSHNMEWITHEAITFINDAGDDTTPFFLYFNPTIPHGSNDVRTALTDFSCRATANGELDADPMIKGMTQEYGNCKDYRQTILDRAETDDDLGSIWLDDAVGALLQALEDKGVLDNTIFLFQQDHGMETKGGLYENGVRIAQFIHFPKGIPGGAQLTAPVSTIDIGPTLLDYANITVSYSMDGLSWRSAAESSAEESIWKADRCLFFEADQDRAVRCGCDKYLSIYKQENDASPTFQSGQRNDLSNDLDNLFDLCGGTSDYVTDQGTNTEGMGSNKIAESAETATFLSDAIACHIKRTAAAAVPDYGATCGSELEGGRESGANEGNTTGASEMSNEGQGNNGNGNGSNSGGGQGSNNEGDSSKGKHNLQIESAFVLSNTEGLTAENVEGEFLESLNNAFRDALSDDGFATLVLEKLSESEQGGNEGDPSGGIGGNGGDHGGPGSNGIGGNGGGQGGIICPVTEQYTGTASETPQAAALRGSIGCVDMAAHELRNTDELPIFQDQAAFNIYGPMEAGFSSAQNKMSCLGDNVVSGGLDTNLAEHVVAYLCPDEKIEVLDACGGHAVPYHYHERMNCLYTADPDTGHSTRIGTAGDGNGIYGKHIDGGIEPSDLDVCGGRFGVTPDSNGEEVYYYPITSAAPFSVGCYGPVNSVEKCRLLYPGTCGSDKATIEEVTTVYGSGMYALDCPCFDEDGSNVEGQGRPGFLAPKAGPNMRRFLEETEFADIYRRGSPQMRRFLQATDFDVDSARIFNIEDTDCPRSISDRSATCQTAYSAYNVTTDGSMQARLFYKAYANAIEEWIEGGGLQDELPNDSPFTVEEVVRLSLGNGSPRKKRNRVLVNSSFLISSPGGKTAEELKDSMDSVEVEPLKQAYKKFVRGVAQDLGANETTSEAEALMEESLPLGGGQGNGQARPNGEGGRPNQTDSQGQGHGNGQGRPNGEGGKPNQTDSQGQGNGQARPNGEGGRPNQTDSQGQGHGNGQGRPNGEGGIPNQTDSQGNGNGQGRPNNEGGRPNQTDSQGNGQGGQGQGSGGPSSPSDGGPSAGENGQQGGPTGDQGQGGDLGGPGGGQGQGGNAVDSGGPGENNQEGSRQRRSLRHRSAAASDSERLLQGRRQFSGVDFDTESAEIYDYKDTPCTTSTTAVSRQAKGDETCITVFGKYRVFVDEGEDVEEVYDGFRSATQDLIAGGRFDATLQEVAEEMNTTAVFAVEGVSSVVDEEFDAFAEIEDDEPPQTPAPTTTLPSVSNNINAPATNETDQGEGSSSGRRFSSLSAILLTFLVGALSGINFCWPGQQ